MINEKKLFDLFRDREGIRPRFEHPHKGAGYVYATDSYALIAVPESMVEGEYSVDEIFSVLLSTFDKNRNHVVTMQMLLDAEGNLPLTDEMTEGIKCEECGGTGEVEWEYYDSSGELHKVDFECPICCGSGMEEERRPTGRKIPDKYALLGFCGISLAYKQVRRMEVAMELMGIDEVTLVSATEKGVLFSTENGILFLIAIVAKEPNYEVISNNQRNRGT